MKDSSGPRAFKITPEPDGADAAGEAASKGAARPAARVVEVVDEPDVFSGAVNALERDDVILRPSKSRMSGWAKLFWSALGGFLSMAVGLWFWRLIEDLYNANPYAGWLGAGLLGLAMLALAALIVREARGLRSLAAASELRDEAIAAAAADDGPRARAVVQHLMAYQSKDATTARQRKAMADRMQDIIDGRDLLTLADRTLMQSRDELARRSIASAARRVSVVTAISPRAIVDILFVAAQSVMLTRRIADIYGARPGTLGFLRLGRRILGHLAITGGVAITDSVLSQLVGHGVAARLSAKLGEGVLNGLLTARVGLAAIAACRPLPFLASEEPKLQDVAGDIIANPLGKKD